MRRKVSARILVVLILINILALMHNAGLVMGQTETIYIRPDGSIDPPTAPIQRNGDTYTFTDNIYESIIIQRNNIKIDGDGYLLQGAGTGTGFNMSNRNNVTIKNTHIKGWNYGIHLYNLSSTNTISDNNLTNNIRRAIFVSNSTSNIINRNRVINNLREGIFLWRTNTTTVTYNNVSNNGEDGIIIGYSSFNNTISYNTVSNNSQAGISFPFEISTDNTIVGNNITQNVWTGIYISWATVSNNKFYHNNLDNTLQVFSVNATNIWDNGYPSCGNYWNDYNGTDLYSGQYQNETGSDGIGDTPYVIDANNQDNHPLMRPASPIPGDVNSDGVVDIFDIGYVSAHWYPGPPTGPSGYDVYADINDDGAVDIFDIGITSAHWGETW